MSDRSPDELLRDDGALLRTGTGGASGSPAPAQVGCYGKLLALGDFIERALPATYIRPWDAWLQRAMVASRAALGDEFDELYLTFPIWRFVIPAGAFGAAPVCGVLSPSVDRVGRCFPLTLAAPLVGERWSGVSVRALAAWLDAFADALSPALSDATIGGFEAALAELPSRLDEVEDSAGGAGPAGGEVSDDVADPAAGEDLAGGENAAAAAIPVGGADRAELGGDGDVHRAVAAESLAGDRLAVFAARPVPALLEALGGDALWWTPPADGQPALVLQVPVPLADELLERLIRAQQ